jgi:hypothetical protein
MNRLRPMPTLSFLPYRSPMMPVGTSEATVAQNKAACSRPICSPENGLDMRNSTKMPRSNAVWLAT